MKIFIWIFSLIVFQVFSVSCEVLREKNVCSSFIDYQTIKTNRNCWYNPDVNAKPHAIAKRHGYRLENHRVVTFDGYILTLHRISPWK
ncbi:hypothetical protein WA026_012132 [Henosepilachna vigintioctopunctata]|uniref:Partial AB-hydrolase lipase domain-containing protein n=1 Tax=Henosepilachna vigintioctopunctata TaxID=420089 RepID=A0AAW1VBE1_9CUCU